MKLFFSLLLCLAVLQGYPSELSSYLFEYRTSGSSSYAKETTLLANANADSLFNELAPYCTDTLPEVRQKVYYLAYKKGLADKSTNGGLAVKLLLRGLDDPNGGIVGQVCGYLQEFSVSSFDAADKEFISQRLNNLQRPHYRELALQAGYLVAGKDVLYRHWLNPELPLKTKWSIALALARMGSAEHSNFCLSKARKAPVGNNLVAYLLSDLIYTRQREAIDFCLEIIKSDTKSCYSLNPDRPEQILCAYQVMVLLAPAIVDFPARIDASGNLETNNYDELLKTVRKWIDEHKEYNINEDSF